MERLKTLVAASFLAAAAAAWADDNGRGANPGDRTGAPAVAGDRSGDPAASRERTAAPAGDRAAGGERTGDPAAVRGDGRRGGGSSSADYIDNMDKAVGLTDEQKKAITAIFETRDKALKDYETQNADKIKEASKRLQDAGGGRDASEAAVKAREEYREALTPMHDIMKKADEDLANVLTPGQKTKAKEYRLAAEIKRLAAPVELTDEQVKKLVGVAEGHEGERGGVLSAISESLDQMLTPEQKESIARTKALASVMGAFRAVRLTRDQATEAHTFYDELAKDKTLKGDELVTKLTEKITSLLTDEQKEALKNAPPSGRVRGRDEAAAPAAPRDVAPADRGGSREGAPAAPGGSRDGTPGAAAGSRDGNPPAPGAARN